ncbi:MAG: hypothetical protein A3C27_03015 [Candidatus Levybacteria bacterium RIFCSPHIGHO2_02_FULL_39_36]|nr:MAG: hypothetical protein UT20_C0004G0008 [Candidatus Levybacteria bacterium GW2011_GWA1_39_11]KKR24909.1 MAG: hypothetical protein UT56_C0006G0006 [Candidatus Levybacteria bacterium GW2011_GWB1_39_7]KKR49935.1 MAG: hypothetical protein UT85_C0008G0006 [Candidatus Levybacteria bacterium GW2011_GWA2_40_16]OGH14181.1 MAG: hypothetical protein A2689_01030 [Candidatus Levybacteria bacterium RIFCSPHIGHO2_01_FULL_38_96]OGH25808.1 MAG: hypothetical protein A3E68_01570 [Candidatus Levybacteria bacte
MARKRLRKKLSNKQNFAFKLIALGFLLFLLGTINHVQIFVNSVFLSYKEAPKKELSAEYPVSISIPSVKIKALVEQGGIVNREWILSDKKALYLPTSGRIGEGYNTIFYAHNRENLFGNLKKVKKDDLVLIKNQTGKDFTYKVYFVASIDPRDIKKLYSEEKDIITLFTCDGWFDQERLLVRAKLIKN